MKSNLLPLLMSIGLLSVIATPSGAQSKQLERDWIDSLSVTYRINFVENVMLRDQVTLDSMAATLNTLMLNMRSIHTFHRTSEQRLMKAIYQYRYLERQAQLRRQSYEEEIRLARTNFSALQEVAE